MAQLSSLLGRNSFWKLAVLMFVWTSGFNGAAGRPFHFLAALPAEVAPQLSRILTKSFREFEVPSRYRDRPPMMLVSKAVPNDTEKAISILCEALEATNPSALISILDKPRGFVASLVAGYVSVPVLGLTRDTSDEAAKEVNRLYLSLDPTASDLADAVFHLLRDNHWYDTIMVMDDSQTSAEFAKHLADRSTQTPWRQPLLIQLQQGMPSLAIFERISDIKGSHRRIVILYADSNTSAKVFEEAGKLNLLNGEWVWIALGFVDGNNNCVPIGYPCGLLTVRPRARQLDSQLLHSVVNLVTSSVSRMNVEFWEEELRNVSTDVSCWYPPSEGRKRFTVAVYRELKKSIDSTKDYRRPPFYSSLANMWEPPVFDVLNALPCSHNKSINTWKVVGNITGSTVHLETIRWLGSSTLGPRPTGKQRFRVVTAYAPPFMRPSTKVENGSCLLGIPCLQVNTKVKEELIAIFNDYAEGKSEGVTYHVACCAGISIDLLQTIARDLVFDFDLYIVADGLFGVRRAQKWDGITADLINGVAHLAFSAFSVTSDRAEVIDFSVPYYYSGVSCLSFSKYTEVPLSAFLVPFSVQLWVAIFMSLNATAIAAAIYEWLSPFGLNPWGRQRTKNFSLASALWVMWSLLFSHLVAFKAPKSWPNKVLINLWGCFSVIFLASYTANIAALFAGLFFDLEVNDFHDASLLSQRTGTAKSSAAEGYVFKENPRLWQHIQKYGVANLQEGLEKLRNSELDVLIGDTAILDYFRGKEGGCNLRLLGDPIFDDAYGVGMQQGFPLKDAISRLILRYNEFGYLDQLQRKWYGRVPCFEAHMQGLNKPKPLGIKALAGVFIMLGVGVVVGIVISFVEHLVFKYALPVLRKKPKDCIWKSPNLMFFSQKLYRFINTVELVSPHHSAKEIMTNLREGQIASLFQKSVKRKAKEEARRRKSKSQFFEMIQEIRKVVQQQHQDRLVPRRGSVLAPLAIRNRSPTSRLGTFQQETIALLNRTDVKQPIPVEPSASGTFPASFRGLVDKSLVSTSPMALPPYEESSSSSSSSDQASAQQAQNVLSISLDDIATQWLDDTERKTGRKKLWERQKVWSFDDLSTLKTRTYLREEEESKRTSGVLKHRRRPWRSLGKPIDELRLYAMTKEEIVQLWRWSERELINQLKEVLQQKRALEEKLAFIQRTLLKPP